MENEEKSPKPQNNIKLAISFGMAVIGLILLMKSKKKENKENKDFIEVKQDKEKQIIINNYINKDEVKNHGKPRKQSSPKPDDQKPDFIELDPDTGKDKSDDK